ncbi:MAG: hypothetical protein C0454_12950 [Parvibaculum sp.]|nr:hypothetical protein [Parvibaculum sp.]
MGASPRRVHLRGEEVGFSLIPPFVMTRFRRVIHVFLFIRRQDVDGPDKPGHDVIGLQRKTPTRPATFPSTCRQTPAPLSA